MPTPKPLDPLPKPPANPFRFTLAEVADKDVALGTTGFHLDTRCGAAPGTMTRPGHIDAGQSGGAGFDGTEGVVMPFPRACTVRAYETNAADAPTWSVVALDSKHPTEAYLLRTRLVKRGSSYAFKDGQMTEVSSDLPSTFAAGAALPGTIIGGFFSGIVSGIQGPQSVYKTQADLLNAKASVYDAQAALLKAQTAAKTDDKTDSNATEAN
jgi:hypothetical protein